MLNRQDAGLRTYIHGLMPGAAIVNVLATKRSRPMPRTRAFKSGNSQAIRLPAEIAYADTDVELEITRLGDVITIVPARHSLKDTVARLRRMPKPARIERRVPIDVPLRKRD